MAAKSRIFDDLIREADRAGPGADVSLLKSYAPKEFSTEELSGALASSCDLDKPGRVLALRVCLETAKAQPERLRAGPDEEASRRQIRRFATRIMAPIVEEEEGDNDDEESSKPENTEHRAHVVQRCRSVAGDSIAVLQLLVGTRGLVSSDDDDDVQLVLTLVAAADTTQPWTARASAASAGQLLERWLPPPIPTEWVVEAILQGYLRRLFARARPATITPAGRAAAFGEAAGGGGDVLHAESRQRKPWKYADLRAISVFAWALDHSDDKLLGQHWPLFIPVLLALVDDADTAVRSRGLRLLGDFLAKLPDQGRLLRTTGLDRVLADAVMPTLLFLPRLTPEKESLELLGPAYAALLALTSAVGAADGTKENTPRSMPPKPAAALLDRTLRDGIYAGYFHASEFTRIVEILMQSTAAVVTAMGVYAVKHLKDLLPMYGAVLTDPFAMRHTPTVVATIAALQATLASCWPRLASTPWQEETTRMLVLCWLNVLEDPGRAGVGGGDGQEKVRDGLVRAADTLLAVMRAADVDVPAKIGPLVAKEPRLKDLFRIDGGTGDRNTL